MEFAPISAFSLHEPEVAAGDVEPAVYPDGKTVGGVVGTAVLVVLGDGDVADEGFRRAVGDAVLILVLEDGQVHAGKDAGVLRDDGVEDPELVAEGNQAAGVVDFRKNGVLVGFAIVVCIDEADDASFARAFAERAEEIDTDVNLTGGGGG